MSGDYLAIAPSLGPGTESSPVKKVRNGRVPSFQYKSNNPAGTPLPGFTAQVTPLGLWPSGVSPAREISQSPGKKESLLRLARLGREDRWGTCCLSALAGYGFNKNTRKKRRGGGEEGGWGWGGGDDDDDSPCCLRDQVTVTPLVKRKLLRKVHAPPPGHHD